LQSIADDIAVCIVVTLMGVEANALHTKVKAIEV